MHKQKCLKSPLLGPPPFPGPDGCGEVDEADEREAGKEAEDAAQRGHHGGQGHPGDLSPRLEKNRPAVRYFFFVSATQSATSATFKLQLIHLII